MYGAFKDQLATTLQEITAAGLHKSERELTSAQSAHITTAKVAVIHQGDTSFESASLFFQTMYSTSLSWNSGVCDRRTTSSMTVLQLWASVMPSSFWTLGAVARTSVSSTERADLARSWRH